MLRTILMPPAWLVVVLLGLQTPYIFAETEPSFALPSREVRVGIIEALKSEVERVDGDGLLPRATRPQGWEKTIALLKDEAARAHTPDQFGRVLHRFDATIPNHHMEGFMPEALEPYTATPFPFSARPELIAGETQVERWRVSGVSTAAWSGADMPMPGDELLAINSRQMSSWSEENYIFCKSPLRSQCERELFQNLNKQVLAWHRAEPLRLRLHRAGRTWEASVPMEKPASPPSSPQDDAPRPLCGVEQGRYPGFEPAYVGVNACVFKSKSHTGVYHSVKSRLDKKKHLI